MRKLIVCSMISLDGYVEGPGGDVHVMPMDEFFDEQNLERLRAADTLLLGATTCAGFKGFWPPVADNPEVLGVVRNPALAEVHRGIGLRLNEIEKVVVSDSLTMDDTAPWTDTTTIVRRRDAHKAVAELKDRPGEEIFMSGSRTLFNELLAAGLVDELRFMVGAAVLGRGTPAFDAGRVHTLRLVSTLRRDGSDNLLLRYEVVNVTNEKALGGPRRGARRRPGRGRDAADPDGYARLELSRFRTPTWRTGPPQPTAPTRTG